MPTEYCPNCTYELGRSINDKAYTAFGLPNVTLKNWDCFDCVACHYTRAVLPDHDKAQVVIAKALLTKPSLLCGEEITFLRHAIGMKSQEFADKIGTMRAHLCRLEKNEFKINLDEDMSIRTFVSGGLYTANKLDFSEMGPIDEFLFFTPAKEFRPGFHINIIRTENNELGCETYYSN